MRSWAAKAAKLAAGPSAPGSKQVPVPRDPNCLSGLSLVFTGELTAFSRDEAVDLAKRFGAYVLLNFLILRGENKTFIWNSRVVGQPSSRTSYVVLGADAGPSKLAAIKKNNLKTLDEDGFLNLIATRVPDLSDEKTKKKIEKEQDAIRQAAHEMENREKKAVKAQSMHVSISFRFEAFVTEPSFSPTPLTSQLWTARYAPRTLKEICGNKGQVEKLQLWLHDWFVSTISFYSFRLYHVVLHQVIKLEV